MTALGGKSSGQRRKGMQKTFKTAKRACTMTQRKDSPNYYAASGSVVCERRPPAADMKLDDRSFVNSSIAIKGGSDSDTAECRSDTLFQFRKKKCGDVNDPTHLVLRPSFHMMRPLSSTISLL